LSCTLAAAVPFVVVGAEAVAAVEVAAAAFLAFLSPLGGGFRLCCFRGSIRLLPGNVAFGGLL